MSRNYSVHNLNKERMKVVRNEVVFFILFLLDCVTTHTACQMVHIPGVQFDGELEEEKVFFQVCYLPSKGRTAETVLVTCNPGLSPPRRSLCSRGMGPIPSRCRRSEGSAWGFSVRPVWQPSVAGKSMNFGARQTCFFVLFFYSIFT